MHHFFGRRFREANMDLGINRDYNQENTCEEEVA
jgi:hypothetical protein